MLDINVVSFLVFDMLILGLSISAFRDLKIQTNFDHYWRGPWPFLLWVTCALRLHRL
jgi:hypothetical protein